MWADKAGSQGNCICGNCILARDGYHGVPGATGVGQPCREQGGQGSWPRGLCTHPRAVHTPMGCAHTQGLCTHPRDVHTFKGCSGKPVSTRRNWLLWPGAVPRTPRWLLLARSTSDSPVLGYNHDIARLPGLASVAYTPWPSPQSLRSPLFTSSIRKGLNTQYRVY